MAIDRKAYKKTRYPNIKIHKDGLTVVPLMIYFNERNYAKVSIAIAKGKKLHDKRADMKAKTLDREAKQVMKSRSYS